MGLEVIGAGLGRNGTMSMKFAMEQLGFGPCYHMLEVFRAAPAAIPQWLEAVNGRPDWDAIFSGYRATTDYPAASYWRELADHFPNAKVVLTTRDPDTWFDSVSETIFHSNTIASVAGTPFGELLDKAIFDEFGEELTDRSFMTDWYVKRNEAVVASLPPERLLVFHPRQGWKPLCDFLGMPVPSHPFPQVNDRLDLSGTVGEKKGLRADPAELQQWAEAYIADMRSKAAATA